ncbi:MAG: segregation/condensation protein A [Nanoarchaeota archaeon]|nr:segregation/condensation protein A [Nanoarchaeota archaeon]MBU4456309.1 segregation/condensation protein A [Nanoarchaeota archaeon]MCG2719477.1 segregation/condensation protein A [Nanoarchaeota archaeon]
MHHEKILNILTEQNEVTWQDIIYGLIRSEEMDPWDIDIGKLTRSFLEIVKELKSTNFHLNGKVLFAAALLVKIKSEKLLHEDIAHFDSILFPQSEEMMDDLSMDFYERPEFDVPPLCIKTPQARKRRVSVQDLVGALERALNINKRRVLRKRRFLDYNIPDIPEKKINLTELIVDILTKIKNLFQKKEEVTFSRLLPEGKIGKEEKIFTLMPLLHLDHQSKIDLEQLEHFGEIYIREKL